MNKQNNGNGNAANSGISFGVIPHAVTTTIKERKGETVKSTRLSGYAVEVYETDAESGKTLRHFPLACAYKRFGLENVPASMSREKAIVYAMGLAKSLGVQVKSYILRDYAESVKALHEKAGRAVKRIEKQIEGGENAFMEAKAENATSQWKALPENLKVAKKNVADLAKLMPKSRKGKSTK